MLTEIDPRAVIRNAQGFAWSEYMIRLPAGMVADDLKRPEIFARVQKSANALKRHDRVYIVAYDESWAVEAIVSDGDKGKAVLCKPRMISFAERYDRLFEDDLYRVQWWGIGYGVERKADGHRMTQPVASAAMAERDLRNLYPKAA